MKMNGIVCDFTMIDPWHLLQHLEGYWFDGNGALAVHHAVHGHFGDAMVVNKGSRNVQYVEYLMRLALRNIEC